MEKDKSVDKLIKEINDVAIVHSNAIKDAYILAKARIDKSFSDLKESMFID